MFLIAPVRNRNRKLEISIGPTKAKLQEPGYSQTLIQNKVDRQQARSRELGRQTVRRIYGGWCLRREGGREKRLNQNRICRRAVFSVWSERVVQRKNNKWARCTKAAQFKIMSS